jgi:hypothetical protein
VGIAVGVSGLARGKKNGGINPVATKIKSTAGEKKDGGINPACGRQAAATKTMRTARERKMAA